MWESQIIHWLQDLGAWLPPLMQAFSALGYPSAYIVLVVFVYWCLSPALGLRLALLLPLAGVLLGEMKLFCGAPRPYWVDAGVVAHGFERDFGMPSGHALSAAAMWGFLAAWLARPWVWAVCLGLIGLIGLSRPVLGVHYPGQVLAGWALGGAMVALGWWLQRPLARWLDGRPVRQVGLTLAVAALLLLAGLWLRGRWAGWEPPLAWLQNNLLATHGRGVVDPLRLKYVFMHTGVFTGVALGAAWLARRGGFRPAAGWPKRLACLGLGLAGALLLNAGVEAVYGLAGETALGLGGGLALAALNGFWAMAGAPLLFIRLGWAAKAQA